MASPLSAATALGLICLLDTDRAKNDSVRHDAWVMLCIVLLTPALLTAAITPMPMLPRYPKSAHVVPFDGGGNVLPPLIGPTYPFESIYRSAEQSLYGLGAILVLIAAVAAFVLNRERASRAAATISTAGIVLSGCAVLDTLLSAGWSSIAPIASASRLLPWGTHYSLLSVVLATAAWALGYTVVMARAGRVTAIGVVATLALGVQGTRELYHPFLRTHGLKQDPSLSHILRTPSAGIIRDVARQQPAISEWLASIKESSNIPAKEAADIGATVSIYPEPSAEALQQARQIENSWRWSTRTGSQRGNERLTVRLARPLQVRGIELDPGTYFTDYPRGLRILGGDCGAPEQAQLVYNAPSWQGALNLTARGVPYYTPRNDVRVVFPQRTGLVQCLFVEQTGKARNDWSVSRVRILE